MPSSEGIPLGDFLEDAFETIDWGELRAVVPALDAKSRYFQSLLQPPERIPMLTRAELEPLLATIFAVRRHCDQVLGLAEDTRFQSAATELIYGDNQDLGARLDKFLGDLHVVSPGIGVELAGELLHFTYPQRYWLWARWMYAPESHTGILPLLQDGDKELRGGTMGQTYLRVGRAIAVVTEVQDAKWLFRGGLGETPAQRPFAIDTFLAAAYAAYAYGITAWRLTREFHKILPPLPRLVRRMLGVTS